jgi:GAF domain-containing protein
MASTDTDRIVEKLRRQQAALAKFGRFAFNETDLLAILTEAARICAASLGVPFCKVCRYRPTENDLLIEAGCGWDLGVVGRVVSQADETSPQGRAYVTGEPVIIRDVRDANNLVLPDFYPQHGIISTVDVVISALNGASYGVLEIDSPSLHQYDEHDIDFLTGFANVLAEAIASAQKNKAIQALLERQKLLASGNYSPPWGVELVELHPERITGTPVRAARSASSAVRPCSWPVAMTLAAAP